MAAAGFIIIVIVIIWTCVGRWAEVLAEGLHGLGRADVPFPNGSRHGGAGERRKEREEGEREERECVNE